MNFQHASHRPASSLIAHARTIAAGAGKSKKQSLI
jgi:hypothetical protein